MSLDTVTRGVAAALRLPDARPSALRVENAVSGGNSRVFVVTLDGRTLVAKQYFRHPSDGRNRLQAERAFLEYAAAAGVDCVPRVVACDETLGIGIYEHIAGRKLDNTEVSRARVREAADFFLKLNQQEHRALARALPSASEACFSVADHLQAVDARIRRLENMPGAGDAERAAREFLAALRRRWQEVRDAILGNLRASGVDAAAEVEERCISPSDFGFHNALLRETGALCFLDFEYAGWDDPAKMVGDFFAHPGIPVPRGHFEEFLGRTMSFSRHAPALEARARLLEPIFRVKWCCIILNEFLPEAAERRRFAAPGLDEDHGKLSQLDKARRLLATI
jgi:hypothetical protein